MTTFAISERARRQIETAQRWWLQHRDKAPDALEEDLRAAYDLIADAPHVGSVVKTRRIGTVRRFLLHRSRYYIYYRVDREAVEILALWHSSRRPPRAL